MNINEYRLDFILQKHRENREEWIARCIEILGRPISDREREMIIFHYTGFPVGSLQMSIEMERIIIELSEKLEEYIR